MSADSTPRSAARSTWPKPESCPRCSPCLRLRSPEEICRGLLSDAAARLGKHGRIKFSAISLVRQTTFAKSYNLLARLDQRLLSRALSSAFSIWNSLREYAWKCHVTSFLLNRHIDIWQTSSSQFYQRAVFRLSRTSWHTSMSRSLALPSRGPHS